ncbi:MAG: hypothetical protein BGP01_08315 [Paludibacter sp. 47-17]|nr:MAG: hypothetical protein ABS72_01955 [Paludibacter sp. SCN 50-10]OJX83272.1 MAG: hypothetical protein BGP01_08315 [Paludibacter sp. 47-17]
MAKLISLTAPTLNSNKISKIKSATNDDSNGLLNPIVEEFANLDIADESGTEISFFDLSDDEKELFSQQWTIANTEAMTPKLNDPEIGKELEDNDHPDFVEPSKVLEQLRTHANRGDVLINLPGTVWLSAYLNYYNPLAISKYVGIGKYPPGHVSIVKQTKTNLPTLTTTNGTTISAQNGSGVRDENVDYHWNCKAHLCYVRKREWRWRGLRSGFVDVYPNADKVIAYAESQKGKPYCSGGDFITAKFRDNCFICTTITWRSFNSEGFNTHRLSVRWMPTIAPADILLSDNIVEKYKIK